MGTVTIQEYTTKNPITMIGTEAGICWGSNVTDQKKNYARGIDCLESEHGRAFEFPDVYMELSGYSARVIREWYTHIGGMPTRLQESTRYLNFKNGFEYCTPNSISSNPEALIEYTDVMQMISNARNRLEELGVQKEDAALVLPLGMATKIVCKHNLRNLIDMSHQRMCTRAYHEYRQLFSDVICSLRNYSEEWAYIVDRYFQPKCKYMGFCKEKKTCGLVGRREDVVGR